MGGLARGRLHSLHLIRRQRPRSGCLQRQAARLAGTGSTCPKTAPASERSRVPAQAVSAVIAGDSLRRTFLHADWQSFGPAGFRTKGTALTTFDVAPQPRAVTSEISFGSRMHEASLQDLEAIARKDPPERRWSPDRGLRYRVWRIIFLPANVPARLIKPIENLMRSIVSGKRTGVNRHNYG